ncbi:MAG: phosphate ABC transporter permease [Bacteroidetes bacterium GWA2_30_7]|nr:MAG: phosphate ABC transporter permease [Bacteroidetes bacterium GWA2_30_7]
MTVKTIINNSSKITFLNINWLRDIIYYKDLFYTLAWREFRVRYAQTFLGFAWAFLQPLATLFIFFFVFGKAIKVDTGTIPYPVFALIGLTAWSYFSFVISTAGRSIITESAMIKKIYFPRLVIPLSKALVGLIDFIISFLLLILSMIYFQTPLSINVLWLPVFLILIILISVGVGIWISALSIRFRDVQHIIPFYIQIGLYATPVAYSSSLIPIKYQFIYHILNPLAGVIEGFRWCMIGGELRLTYFLYSIIIICIIFISSLFYFRKVERVMADIL